jgi:hypothetical protein
MKYWQQILECFSGLYFEYRNENTVLEWSFKIHSYMVSRGNMRTGPGVHTEQNIRLYLQIIYLYLQTKRSFKDLHTIIKTVTSNKIFTILYNIRITCSPNILDRLWAKRIAKQILWVKFYSGRYILSLVHCNWIEVSSATLCFHIDCKANLLRFW